MAVDDTMYATMYGLKVGSLRVESSHVVEAFGFGKHSPLLMHQPGVCTFEEGHSATHNTGCHIWRTISILLSRKIVTSWCLHGTP